MTRDQLRLVLQPDDQLVKIKTVTAIDDHSDGEHPGVEQDLQSRQVYFRTHPLRPQPHSSSGAGRAARAPDWALMLTRLLNSGERIMNRLCIAVLTTLLVALAGCSGDSASGPTPIPSSEPPAAAAPATVGPSTSPIPAVPVNECLSGRYRLVRFAGVGERGSYGTGEGGDVTVTFNNGSYLLSGEGKEPITAQLARSDGWSAGGRDYQRQLSSARRQSNLYGFGEQRHGHAHLRPAEEIATNVTVRRCTRF